MKSTIKGMVEKTPIDEPKLRSILKELLARRQAVVMRYRSATDRREYVVFHIPPQVADEHGLRGAII